MAKKSSRKKRDTKQIVIKKLLKELVKKPRKIKRSKSKDKTSKKLKKKRRIEPLSSNKNSAILRKLSARAVQNRNLGY